MNRGNDPDRIRRKIEKMTTKRLNNETTSPRKPRTRAQSINVQASVRSKPTTVRFAPAETLKVKPKDDDAIKREVEEEWDALKKQHYPEKCANEKKPEPIKTKPVFQFKTNRSKDNAIKSEVEEEWNALKKERYPEKWYDKESEQISIKQPKSKESKQTFYRFPSETNDSESSEELKRPVLHKKLIEFPSKTKKFENNHEMVCKVIDKLTTMRREQDNIKWDLTKRHMDTAKTLNMKKMDLIDREQERQHQLDRNKTKFAHESQMQRDQLRNIIDQKELDNQARQTEVMADLTAKKYKLNAERDIAESANHRDISIASIHANVKHNAIQSHRDIELSGHKLIHDDNQNERNHVHRMKRLDKASEIADIVDTFRDKELARKHQNQTFQDERIKNARAFGDANTIMRGVSRKRKVEEIFKRMGLPHPDDMDLTKPWKSGEVQLIENYNRWYRHSILITGVNYVHNTT